MRCMCVIAPSAGMNMEEQIKHVAPPYKVDKIRLKVRAALTLMTVAEGIELQRETVVATIFNENSTIDLPFMNTTFLVSVVHNTRRFGGFLQDTNLVLSTTAVVISNWRRNSLEPVVSLGIVNAESTAQRPKIISMPRPNSRK